MTSTSTTNSDSTLAEPNSATVVRQFNWPVLIGTVFAIIAGGVGAYFLRDYQVQRTAQTYWDRALALEADGDRQQALGYLHRYTRFRPEDGAAQAKLARDFAEANNNNEGKWRSIKLYYQAIGVAQEDERLALRSKIADLLLETNQLSLAKAQAFKIRNAPGENRDDLKAKNNAERVLAEVLYQQYVRGAIGPEPVDGETIGEIISRARTLNPRDMRMSVILAHIHRSQPQLLSADETATEDERNSKADQIMAELVASDPDSWEIRLAYFEYLQHYKLPGADEELNKVIELGPDVLAVRLAVAKYWQQKGELLLSQKLELSRGDGEAISVKKTGELFAQARKHLKYILDHIDANSESAHIAMGDVFAREGRFDEAKMAWNKGLRAVGDMSLSLNMRLAEALARENDPGTKECLQQLDHTMRAQSSVLSSDVRDSLTRTRNLIEALWLLEQDKHAQAIPLLKPIAAEVRGYGTRYHDSIKALQMLARAHQALDRPEDAAKAYELAIEAAPHDWQFRLRAASMWRIANQPELAVKHLQRVVPAVIKTPEAWMALARNHYDAILRRPKQDRDWKPFETAMTETRKAMGNQIVAQPWLIDLLEANYQLAIASNKKDGRTNALKILQRVEKENRRDDLSLCATLASAYEGLGEPGLADECLKRLTEIAPGSHIGFLKRAEILMRRKDFDNARTALNDGIKQLPTKEQLPLQKALVPLAMTEGDFDTAEAELTKLYDLNRSDPHPLYVLLELALRRGKVKEAAQWEAKLYETEGDVSTLARYFRVWRLSAVADDANDPRLRQAAQEYRALYRERPNWAFTYLAAARLYEKLGEFPKVSDALEDAVRLGEKRPSTYERLVQALSVQGRFIEADRYLKKLENHIPSSTRLSSLAIHVAAHMDNVERAEQIARDGTDRRPKDPIAWLWYGQILLTQKKNEKAEQACRKAMELAPDDIRTWHGLFTCFYRAGHREKASNLLAKMSEHVKLSAGHLAFVQAQGYELLSNRNAAKRHYAIAEKEMPDENQFALQMRIAQFHLSENAELATDACRKALKIDPTSGPARRMLASSLAADPASWKEAVEMLEKGGDADLRVLGALRVLRRSDDRVADLEASRRILEGLVLRSVNPLDSDRFLLALIYSELSKVQLTPEARDSMVQSAMAQFQELLVGRAEPTIPHLSIYIRFLLDQQKIEEAKRWLAVWERDNPGTMLYVALKARWLHASGEDEKIEPLVEETATKLLEQRTSEEGKLSLYSSVGRVYARVGNHAASRRWFDRLATTGKERFGPLALSLAAQGLHMEAIKLCLHAAESDDSPRPALMLAAVLVGIPEYQPSKEAEKLFAETLEKHPKDFQLLTSIANLRLVQGKTSVAIELYRQVLELRPNDPSTLNNLATLLADEEGHSAEALKFIDRAIDYTGPRPALLDTKGTILLRAGRLKEAIAALDTAASDPQADPRYRFHLAVALNAANESARAKSELKAALDDDLTSQILTQVDQADLTALRQKYEL